MDLLGTGWREWVCLFLALSDTWNHEKLKFVPCLEVGTCQSHMVLTRKRSLRHPELPARCVLSESDVSRPHTTTDVHATPQLRTHLFTQKQHAM